MKLILTAAVENLGVPGDIVEVKNGYGRNQWAAMPVRVQVPLRVQP